MADAPLAERQGSKAGLLIKRLLVFGVPALVVVGTGVGMTAIGALAPQPEEKEEVIEALPVVVARAEEVDLTLKVTSQGAVKARSEVTLSPEVSGRISYVSPDFVAGGHFRRGDVLVRLDARDFELRVVQAKASVAQAQTVLAREESEARNARIEADELGISDVSDLALREPQVAEAKARLESAKAALREAELQLAKTIIRAPFDGRMISKSVDRGAYVGPGSALANIFSTDVVEIPIALTDHDLGVLDLPIGFEASEANPGPSVQLTAIIAGERRTWTGEIRRTASGFDPDTRVLFAYVEVDDPFGEGASDGVPLATGLFVEASIEGPTKMRAITIPRTALRGSDKVYVVEEGGLMRIAQVEVTSSDRQRAIIASGIAVGDQVITSPVRSPADGMTVKPVDDPAMSPEKTSLIASAETIKNRD